MADENCFVGFDAFQKVIDSGVDMVIWLPRPISDLNILPLQWKPANMFLWKNRFVLILLVPGRLLPRPGKPRDWDCRLLPVHNAAISAIMLPLIKMWPKA